MEDAAGSDFARVKSLWQTRVTRAASREAPPATAAPAAAPAAAARSAALSPRAKPTRSDKQQPQQKQHKQPDAPHTPAPDEYFYAREKRDGDGGDVVESAQLVPSPVSSSTSTMSVSPSKSVTPVTAAPVSVVNSVLRRVSDATMRTRSTSSANNSGVVAIGSDGAASNESSPKEGGSHLSLSSIPVPDMSSWKGKMMSYSSRGSKHSPPSSANSSTTSAPTTSKLSLSSISTTWKSMSAHTMKAALSEMNAPVDGVELAKNNIHSVCSKTKPYAGNNALTIGSPYGELIVVEVLAARELAIRDDGPEGADARPFATVEFNSIVRKSLAPRHASSNRTFAFNERFVFWVPSSPTIDQQNVSFTFHQMADRTTSNNKNSSSDDDDSHLGEVHLSLAMPVNEVFNDWFPLVRPIDGAKKGSVHIGLRRLVLTSPTLLEAAKTLASRNRSLNIADKNAFGSTLPELWEGFTDAQDESTGSENTSSGAASSMSLSRLGKPTELLASKFNGLSRRFTGGSAADVRRDVF